ncbi:MAG: hypothetical protein JXR96_22375 [Deltaproteobacteria bacterium]|nr:hypothetical protein [Deltaproteobacteria bacterium]
MADREIGHTRIAAGPKLALCLGFLLIVFGVPAIQLVFEMRQGQLPPSLQLASDAAQAAAIWMLAEPPDSVSHPDFSAEALAADGFVDRLFKANRFMLRAMDAYEKDLGDTSLLTGALLPLSQRIQTELFAVGNEKTLVGDDGWLFYFESIGHLSGPGFLQPEQLTLRRQSGSEWQVPPQPDPVPAILHFQLALARRGIRLVLVPIPNKPSLYPDRVVRTADACRDGVLRNPDTAQMLAELADPRIFIDGRLADYRRVVRDPAFAALAPLIEEIARGRALLQSMPALVYDPSEDLLRARCRESTPVYLRADLHWHPRAAEITAGGLAAFVTRHVELAPSEAAPTRLRTLRTSAIGDIARMLELPPSSAEAFREEVSLKQVLQGDALWRPNPTAQVLLLGDSFTNMFSVQAMGWGEAAGLAEHLGHALGRQVDMIARNDNGAFNSRAALARELARGRDRLAGKRVVIWQFGAHELSYGDWRMIPMDLAAPRPSRLWTPGPGERIQARGTVAAISHTPRPMTVPYKDHICAVHLVDLEAVGPGKLPAEATVAYMFSMRDNRWTRVARLRLGQRVRVRLSEWDAERLGRLNRSDLDAFELEEHSFGELQPETLETQVVGLASAQARAGVPELAAFTLLALLLAGILGLIHRQEQRRVR